MLQLKQEEQRLLDASKVKNEELKKSRELEEKIEKIKNNQREVERIAREQYKMVRPGEIIINLDDDKEESIKPDDGNP